jgi:hypothetical protein
MSGSSINVTDHFNGSYTFKAVSGSGVESVTKSVTVKVSGAKPTAPALTVNGAQTNSGSTIGWTNSPISFSAGGSAVNGFTTGSAGILRYEVKIDGGNWGTYTENTPISITSNTNTTYFFRAISVSGKEGEVSSLTIKYWNSINDPVVEAAAQTHNWYAAAPSIKITAAVQEAEGPAVTTSYIRTVNGVAEAAVPLSQAELTLNGWTDGEYTLAVTATDECGNVSETITKQINIDSLKPLLFFPK